MDPVQIPAWGEPRGVVALHLETKSKVLDAFQGLNEERTDYFQANF